MIESNITHKSWKAAFNAFKNPRVFSIVFLGFSAGLPILLIFSTMSVWLREADVARATISFFSWAALGYAFKFVWAPIIDKLPVPFLSSKLGLRRSWLLIAQLGIILSLILIGSNNPATNLQLTALFAVFLGFLSATQDIVIDAYRIEATNKALQGMMSSSYILGYRLGMLVAGAGALEIVAWFDSGKSYTFLAWSYTYYIMSLFMFIGVFTTLLINEPKINLSQEKKQLIPFHDYLRFFMTFCIIILAIYFWFAITQEAVEDIKSKLHVYFETHYRTVIFLLESIRLIGAFFTAALIAYVLILNKFVSKKLLVDSYVGPLADFFSRYGKIAILTIALIATYRIADVILGVMANVFYIDMGFEKQEIGRITKGFGLIMVIIGGFLGGLMSIRFSIMKTLFLGALLASSTNLLFMILAEIGNDIFFLILVISADNLSAGIASAAFVAYLSSLTSKTFTASQYAIFSSMMLIIPKLFAGYSGLIVDTVGYSAFFLITSLIGVPVLFLIMFVIKYSTIHKIELS